MPRIIFSLIIIIFFIFQAQARELNIKEASFSRDIMQKIVISEKGEVVAINEIKYKILSKKILDEDNFFPYTIKYNKDRSDFEILEAKIIKNRVENLIDKTNILDEKSLDDISYRGFDERRQILITFPKLEIGDEVVIKTKETNILPPIPGHYFDFYDFGRYSLDENYQISITSHIPLVVSHNDPKGILNIENKMDHNGIQNITIKNTKPIFTDFIDETKTIGINPKKQTFISVSSLKNFEELGSIISTNFEKVLSKDIPKSYREIADRASNIKDEVKQISEVIKEVRDKIEHIAYLGNVETIKGIYRPREMHIIDSSNFGDCKDLSTMIAAILRRIGYKANIAIVYRGYGENFYKKLPNMALYNPDRGYDGETFYKALPNIALFNHTIIKVIGKMGKVYWIDGANKIVMVDGIFPEIANNHALILDGNNSKLEKIPEIDYKKSITKTESIYRFDKDWKMYVKSKMNFINEASLEFRLKAPEQNMFLKSNIKSQEDFFVFKIPELTSKIIEDVSCEFRYSKENATLLTNIGRVFSFISDLGLYFSNNLVLSKLSFVQNDTSKYVSDIAIKIPIGTYVSKSIFKNVQVEKPSNLNYSFESPWISFSNKFDGKNNDLVVNRSFEIKKRFFEADELKSEKFKELKKALKNHADPAIAFKQIQ